MKFISAVNTISVTKTRWLKICVLLTGSCDSHATKVNMLCGWNAESLSVKPGGAFSYHLRKLLVICLQDFIR